MDQAEPYLSIRGLSKHFAGTVALDEVDFDLVRGEIHALLGENGAGKSTLIKILASVYEADGGTVRLEGNLVDPKQDSLPIAFIHQDLGLVDTMSVAENVALMTGYPRKHGLIDWRAANARARDALKILGSDLDPDTRVGALPAAEKSMVAIARAVAINADILVLDEPTAALPETDVVTLLETLDRLRGQGIAMIYVSHRLDEVFRNADRVTVLRDGRKVITAKVADLQPADLVQAIVGRGLAELDVHLPETRARTVLAVDQAMFAGVGPVTFTLQEGEILAMVGLRGAGHDLVGRGLFGEIELDEGRLRLEDADYVPSTPLWAGTCGIRFVTSRRREEGMASSLTVRENIYIDPRHKGRSHLNLVRPQAESADADRVLTQFAVRPHDPERVIATLSGGNQQKVILARAIEAEAKLLILEEPTFGVDVGAKADIYRLLVKVLDMGKAVILVSSDFEEVERIAHRALVFDRSRVAAELPRNAITVPRLTAIAGGQRDWQQAS